MHTPRQLLPVAVWLAMTTLLSAQEPTTVSGHVNRGDGAPLSAATVSIPSLGLTTTSRSDGSYGLLVPAEHLGKQVALTVRAIGFKPMTAEITIDPAGVQQDFGLAANPLQLGELVVTGAGTVSEVEKLGA